MVAARLRNFWDGTSALIEISYKGSFNLRKRGWWNGSAWDFLSPAEWSRVALTHQHDSILNTPEFKSLLADYDLKSNEAILMYGRGNVL